MSNAIHPRASNGHTTAADEQSRESSAVAFHIGNDDDLEMTQVTHRHTTTANERNTIAPPPTKMIRGRSYSSANNNGAPSMIDSPFTPADVFSPNFLERPLLQDRGASSKTAQQLFGTPPPRLAMSWNHISQFVAAPTPADPSARKRILCNVSGRAYCGETLAIMGPSGSGKTSLLSLLAGGWRKAREAGNLEGDILVNNVPSTKRMKRFIAMVAQDDLLFANLTVEQTLRYSALLNLPKELSRKEKLQRVSKVIELLGLTKCRGTLIGGGFARGVSGGERKRTSVANEMLANPSLILADEPTSGLDSTTAARLISTFRSLARGGRSVICSIHQPSSNIFELFDKVLLLAQGRTIFYGSSQQVVRYFNSTGLCCKPYYNPADFMLEIVSDLTHEGIAKEEKTERARNSGNTLPNEANHDPTLNKQPKLNGFASSHANGSSANGDDDDTEEPGFAAVMLADDLPAKSYRTDGGVDSAKAERTILRLPVLWARIDTQVLALEDAARRKQIADQDAGDGRGEGSLTLTAEEKALAETSLDVDSNRSNRWPLTWWQQFTLLLSRSFLQNKGERVTKLYAAQTFLIALAVGLVWFQTPRRADKLHELTGSIFFVCIFWSFTPLFNSLVTFPSERAIIIKERAGGSYRLSAYFLAKVFSELPVEMAYPTVFIILQYWLCGWLATPGAFFFTLFSILLSCLCAASYGLLISCSLLDFKKAITFTSVSMLTIMLLSGFYVPISQIPVWLRWASYLAFPKYTYNIVAYIQFRHSEFPCNGALPAGITFSSCPVQGEEVMSQYDFDMSDSQQWHGWFRVCSRLDPTLTLLLLFTVFSLPLWANIIILFGMVLVFRVAAYFMLRRNTKP